MAIHLSRQDAMRKAFDFLKRSEVRGAYYEFGVSTGQTATFAKNAAAKYNTKKGGVDRFFLFDSFEGLPASRHEGDQLANYDAIEEGLFAQPQDVVRNALRDAGHHLDDVHLVPGFYETSLKNQETLDLVAEAPAALVHIDCDLYVSTIQSLDFMTDRIVDGAILMFDDWFIFKGRPDKGEQRAFHEWKERSGLMFNEYFRYHWAGIAFICNTIEE